MRRKKKHKLFIIIFLFKRIRVEANLLARKFLLTNPQAFVYIISIIIGLTGGISAVILKNLVSFTEELIYHRNGISYSNYWIIFLPAIGILLTVIYIKFFVKENISHGVEKVLAAISKNKSRINIKNTYSSIVSSSLTVGFGGSSGLEAPIVYTGAAIGANVADKFNLPIKLRTLFIACGCSAAVAGIFKAPIAAIIFSLEVIMIDLSMWSIIPILISATTGALVSYFFLGDDISFYFAVFEPFDKSKIPFYILLGIICGFYAVYFIKFSRYIEKRFAQKKNIYLKAIIGGLSVGILIFIFPPLFGEGYIGIQHLMSDKPNVIIENSLFNSWKDNNLFLILFLLSILFIKVIASSFTTASGGIGGVFGPALFTGGVLGYIFEKIITKLSLIKLSEHNFTLVGMAGVMAGIMHAPITSIFLIAEITGGYSLLFPLIITATTAYLVKYRFDKYSVYTYHLKKENQMITHNKDKEAILRMNINNLIERDFIVVKSTMKLVDFIKEIIPKSNWNLFIVEDDNGDYLGVIQLDEIMGLLLDKEKYEGLEVKDIVTPSSAVINSLKGDNEAIFNLFDTYDVWYLPVVKNKKYLGMLSKSKLLQKYRKLIIDFSED
ncbi:chloride channel protein [Apibacter muscae]|uniref:Chloride channel protein n=1 Tax=Apibacter muscae TaxID=2509004 RepID=A0A563DH33_9FLAO|nr:chloride channel protein [Apibacter muscae]TWP29134.1 chloride channel protein [Apibacter muscae]